MKDDLSPTAEANALAAALLVEGLATRAHQLGVVLSPGSRNTPLALAFAAHPKISLYVVLDERAAAFVALGMAKATGRAAVVVCTSGSAGAHYAPALTEAATANIPLIAVTADRPLSVHGVGAPQTVDQSGFGLGLVRHAFFLEAPQASDAAVPIASLRLRAWRTTAVRARTSAHAPNPGPVHINAPFTEPLWVPGADAKAGAWAASLAPVVCMPARLRAAPRSLLASFFTAPRGIVVVGSQEGARFENKGLPQLLARVSAHLGWPILADAGSQLRVADLTPGLFCARYPSYVNASVEALRPQRILRLGAWPVSRSLQQYLQAMEGVAQMTLGHDDALCDPLHHASFYVQADVQRTIKKVLTLPAPRSDTSWGRKWQAHERLARESESVSFGGLERAVCAAPSKGDYLYLGNSTPVREVALRAPEGVALGVTVVTSRGVCGIDGAIATLVGLSLARPRRHVFALVGDLTFLHDVGALQTAAQFNVSITIVVVCNGGGRIFEQLPVKAHKTYFETLFVTQQNADFEALCRATGVECETIYDAKLLLERLRARKRLSSPAGLGVFLYRDASYQDAS